MARSQRTVKGKKKSTTKAVKAAPKKATAKAKSRGGLVKVTQVTRASKLAGAEREVAEKNLAAVKKADKALAKKERAEAAREEPKDRRRGPRAIEGVLARLAAAQTLEAGYHAWDELRLERRLALERFAEDGRRLGKQAGFWIGAARAAAVTGAPVPEPLASGDLSQVEPLQRAAAEAEAKLKAAAAEVEAQARKTDAEFAEAELHVRAVIKQRVQRYAVSRPKVHVVRHPAGQGRTILHLQRVSPDESVVLMYLLASKLPTRYGFLFDDSTENVSRPPPWLYADEGVRADGTRPSPRGLEELLLAPQDYAPVKGFIPLFIAPAGGGEPVLHRLLQRGAVMEVEILDADDFRNTLTSQEAEQVAGVLLRLKLDGRIDLELGAS